MRSISTVLLLCRVADQRFQPRTASEEVPFLTTAYMPHRTERKAKRPCTMMAMYLDGTRRKQKKTTRVPPTPALPTLIHFHPRPRTGYSSMLAETKGYRGTSADRTRTRGKAGCVLGHRALQPSHNSTQFLIQLTQRPALMQVLGEQGVEACTYTDPLWISLLVSV